jgi:hypothetical protein
MYHTVYNSYESGPGGRDYIGKHSAVNPYDWYMGSFLDESFDPDCKIIMAYAKTAEGATWFEINFHNVFNVGVNPLFANRAKAARIKFDRTGVKNSDETKLKIKASWTEERKRAITESRTGENHPLWGITMSLETRRKMRAAKIGKPNPGATEKLRGKKRPEHSERMSGERNPKSKRIEVTYPDGSVEVFLYVKLAAKSLGYDSNTLGKWASIDHTPRKGRLAGHTFRYL